MYRYFILYIFRILFKELRVSIICGIVLAVVNFGKILLIDNMLLSENVSIEVAAVVSLTLLLTIIIAKLIGCVLPLLAEKLHFDPAVMASPFITTIVDAVSLLIYFKIATVILGI